MNKVIVRLPGGGRIKKKPGTQELSWWDYRNHYITPELYCDLKNIINRNKDCTFFLISGGVGAFLYADLCDSISSHDEVASQIGCNVVSMMHTILISSLAKNGIKVSPHEVDIDKVNEAQSSNHSCYFIKPCINIMSTDSLAAHTAHFIKADMIVYLKEGAPTYHIGFDVPMKINKWKINDIKSKANTYNGNYIIDDEALNIIKENSIKTIITNPDMFSHFNHNVDNYGFGSSDNYTEVIV
ncbi:hypothetical protein [Aeromonas enteropelogenes]|uniref:hypothetical protein n=1 Tax=Aeromonas enteropelogenes TaxID=29489 RepID=UPI0039880C7E